MVGFTTDDGRIYVNPARVTHISHYSGGISLVREKPGTIIHFGERSWVTVDEPIIAVRALLEDG